MLHSVSMVNKIFVSIEFNVSWKDETSSFPMMLVEHKYNLLNMNVQVVEFCNIWLTIAE